jgi:hypothetical protein
MTGRGYFLPPLPDEPPPPLPPIPPPDPLVAAAVLARMSPAELTALLASVMECQPRPVDGPSWSTRCSCGGLTAPARPT